MIDREKATGVSAVWDNNDNGGRGGWVIPGLSQKMGGPPKGSQATEVADTKSGLTGPLTDQQVQEMKNAPATLDNAAQDFFRGAPQDALDKLMQLEKSNPAIKDDPKYKRLRKHVELELS